MTTLDPVLDGPRLQRQLERVKRALRGGDWFTLAGLCAAVGAVSEAGVSARLRDLRKPAHSGHLVERRRVVGARGLWEYRCTTLGSPQLPLPLEREAA